MCVKRRSSERTGGQPAARLMSLDISLLHFKIDDRSATLKLNGLISESSVVVSPPLCWLYTGGCAADAMTTVSVCTPTSEENMCRFRGFCERGPRTEERWVLWRDQTRRIKKQRSSHYSSRPPLKVALHPAVCTSEPQKSRVMKVITVAVVPYPTLQRRTEQSGSLAIRKVQS